MNKVLFSVLLLIGLGVVVYAQQEDQHLVTGSDAQLKPGPPTTAESVLPATVETPSRFQGKIILISVHDVCSDGRPASEYLKSPVIERIGDRYFITGPVFLTAQERTHPANLWRDGGICSIAVDRVTTLYEFTPEQFEIAAKSFSSDEAKKDEPNVTRPKQND